MMFQLKDVTVTRCGDCPSNIEVPNKILAVLPPSHHCKDTPDYWYTEEGRLILNPYMIPVWCPHVAP